MKKAVLAAAAVLAVAAAYAVTRPSTYRVERSVHVEAGPEVTAAQIVDLHRWLAWSPRERQDPGARRSYGGPAAGPGSTYYWSGTAGLGTGRLTVLSATTDRVELEMEQEEPGPALVDLEFRLAPEGNGTRLTWIQAGSLSFPQRLLRAPWRADAELGAALDRGLAGLKRVAEAEGQVDAYRLERTVRSAAAPEAILAELVDLRRWPAWWREAPLDPATRLTHGGAPSGPGSSAYWSGDDPLGQGRLSILSAGAETVVVELEIVRPRPSSTDLEFRLTPDGTGTRIMALVTGARTEASPSGPAAAPQPVTANALEGALARLASVAESGRR